MANLETSVLWCLYYRNGEMLEHLLKSCVFDNEDDETYKYKEFDNTLRALEENALINVKLGNTNAYSLPTWVRDAMKNIPIKFKDDAYSYLLKKRQAENSQGLMISRRTLFWTIIGVVLVILSIVISILIAHRAI